MSECLKPLSDFRERFAVISHDNGHEENGSMMGGISANFVHHFRQEGQLLKTKMGTKSNEWDHYDDIISQVS